VAVLKNIKLGRAGYESVFELNPSAINYTPTRIQDLAHGLDGSGIDVGLSRNRPTVRINGNYITPEQQNQFLSLLHEDYEPMVFEPMDFVGTNVWESWQERVIPHNTTQFYLPATSFTGAAKWKQLNGSTAVIKPIGLWQDMGRQHGRISGGPNKIVPGIWGQIQLEDFNLLTTGLLSATGQNWLVVNGNGTTRDAWVDTVAPIEGVKDLLITSDGSGTPVLANRSTGGLWDPSSFYAQRGYDVDTYTAIWQAQVIGTNAPDNHQVFASTAVVGPTPWVVSLDVTSPTTVDYSLEVLGVTVVAPTALATPFGAHAYTVTYDGTNLEVKIGVVTIYNQPHAMPPINTFTWMGKGWAAGDVVRYDTINIFDADGYDPSTGLFTLLGGRTVDANRPYFFTYQYNAMLVEMSSIPFTVEGGWVGFSRYDFQLEGI